MPASLHNHPRWRAAAVQGIEARVRGGTRRVNSLPGPLRGGENCEFHKAKVEEREELGGYTLPLRWNEPHRTGTVYDGQAAGYPLPSIRFWPRPLVLRLRREVPACLEVRGRGTALLDQASTIEVTAPLGKGFRIETGLGRAALLGGGIGVAPLKILCRHLDAMSVPHDVILGFADARSAVVAQEFQGAAVATMDGSEGTHGTVLDAAGSLEEYGAVYSCGPNPMLAAVQARRRRCRICQLSVEEGGVRERSCNGLHRPMHGGGTSGRASRGRLRGGVLAW